METEALNVILTAINNLRTEMKSDMAAGHISLKSDMAAGNLAVKLAIDNHTKDDKEEFMAIHTDIRTLRDAHQFQRGVFYAFVVLQCVAVSALAVLQIYRIVTGKP